MAKLIKGGDCSFSMSMAGVVQLGIKDIEDVNLTLEVETIKEQHLGKSGPDVDDVFDGYSLDFSMHMDSDAALQLALAIQQRAANRSPYTNYTFDFSGVFAFPSGLNRLVTFNDLKFKPLKVAIPNRKQHVKFNLQAEGGQPPSVMAI
jgi:hypothetical protein